MKDVKCPYCSHEQDIRYTEDHSNGDMCQQQCENRDCGKYFSYEVHIAISYTPYTLDCANSEIDIHKWEDCKYLKNQQTCADCGEGRTKNREKSNKFILKVKKIMTKNQKTILIKSISKHLIAGICENVASIIEDEVKLKSKEKEYKDYKTAHEQALSSLNREVESSKRAIEQFKKDSFTVLAIEEQGYLRGIMIAIEELNYYWEKSNR